jgi:hypothetical protein
VTVLDVWLAALWFTVGVMVGPYLPSAVGKALVLALVVAAVVVSVATG